MIGLGAFYWFLHQTAGTAQFMNVAGRQRLLSQQISDYARMVATGQDEDRPALRELLSEFEKALGVLERGGHVMGEDLSPAPPEVLDEIARVMSMGPHGFNDRPRGFLLRSFARQRPSRRCRRRTITMQPQIEAAQRQTGTGTAKTEIWLPEGDITRTGHGERHPAQDNAKLLI